MANRTEVMNRVNEVRGTDSIEELIIHMVNKGFTSEEWDNVEKADFAVVNALAEFFGMTLDTEESSDSTPKTTTKTRRDKKTKDAKSETEEKPKTKTQLKAEAKAKAEAEKKAEEEKNAEEGKELDMTETPKAENVTQIRNKYKTIHNIIGETDAKETVLENVKYATDLGEDVIYHTTLNGRQLVEMFMGSTLIFDPTMQRGIKEDKAGQTIANFTDSHVRDITDAMIKNEFSTSLIEFAVITNDSDVTYDYNEDEEVFSMFGHLRLLDGQHRTRALVKLFQMMKTGKADANFSLEKYVFPIQIHVTSAEFARIIYNNINKMRKLDKSQSRQLSNDRVTRIVNALNMYSDSPLRNKIALAKPVGNKLVLFSTMAERLDKVVKVDSTKQMDEVRDYLIEFFDYLTDKLPEAFGDDAKSRLEFRKNNLLNENNFFEAWLNLAFADKDNYKQHIDKIAENVEYFNKDATIEIDGETRVKWEYFNAIKKAKSREGYAIANTSTGKDSLTEHTFELLGLQR